RANRPELGDRLGGQLGALEHQHHGRAMRRERRPQPGREGPPKHAVQPASPKLDRDHLAAEPAEPASEAVASVVIPAIELGDQRDPEPGERRSGGGGTRHDGKLTAWNYLSAAMRIALLYHGVLPVERYGGTERVVVWLARGLAELGHEVVLIAGPGSKVPEARLVPVDPQRAEHAGFDVRPHLPKGVEVLHAHRPLEPIEVPTLWTMHGNARPGRHYPTGNMVCLSAHHAQRHGTRAFVYNGLDPADYRFAVVKGDFDLFLGRLHSQKGWRWAGEGARRAGRRLVVAGGWRPTLRPELRFVGTVGGWQKSDLLAEAACLWMPALWDEPFGLTQIEALVSGTPVLG